MPAQTVGQFLFDYLFDQGVTHAFGIPGDFALPTFRWLDRSKIKLITMTHEPSVGFAADGYARMKGLGVACVTYCVGGLNMLNAVACAYAEKSPLLVISGGPGVNDRRRDPMLHHKVRTFDTQRAIYQEVTCATAVLLDPDTAADEIIRVVEAIKVHCRPGYIEIPFDIVDLPCNPPRQHKKIPAETDPENLAAALTEATEFIARAHRPVIIADIELHRHGLTDLAVAIAEKFNIPIASTLLSKSLISENVPAYIGTYAGGISEPGCQKYVDNSDCVIIFGAMVSDVFLGFNTVTLNRKRCILANTEKIRIGLHGYDNVSLNDFMAGIVDAPISPKAKIANPNPAQEQKPLAPEEKEQPLDVETFFRLLSLMMPEGSTLVCDTGDALVGAIGIRTTKRSHFLSDAYYLSMGFAMPAAIGAMAAEPNARTIVLIGDGAFQMTGIELSTAAKEGMKPIIFIINNDGYGTQRHIIDGPFNNILPWHYTRITDLLGHGKSIRITTKGQLESTLKSTFAENELTVIELVVPRDNCSHSLRRMAEQLGRERDISKRQ